MSDHIPEIRARRLAGETFGEIAKALNDAGHRTPKGSVWYYATVERALRRASSPRKRTKTPPKPPKPPAPVSVAPAVVPVVPIPGQIQCPKCLAWYPRYYLSGGACVDCAMPAPPEAVGLFAMMMRAL